MTTTDHRPRNPELARRLADALATYADTVDYSNLTAAIHDTDATCEVFAAVLDEHLHGRSFDAMAEQALAELGVTGPSAAMLRSRLMYDHAAAARDIAHGWPDLLGVDSVGLAKFDAAEEAARSSYRTIFAREAAPPQPMSVNDKAGEARIHHILELGKPSGRLEYLPPVSRFAGEFGEGTLLGEVMGAPGIELTPTGPTRTTVEHPDAEVAALMRFGAAELEQHGALGIAVAPAPMLAAVARMIIADRRLEPGEVSDPEGYKAALASGRISEIPPGTPEASGLPRAGQPGPVLRIRKAGHPIAELPLGPDRGFDMPGSLIKIGRLRSSDVCLDDESVAKRHAVIERIAEGWQLIDLGSPGGSRINGKPVASGPFVLGDVIEIGKFELSIVTHGGAGDRPAEGPSRFGRGDQALDGAAVDTRFVDLFYIPGGRVALRFEGVLCPLALQPDDARRLALAISTEGKSQTGEGGPVDTSAARALIVRLLDQRDRILELGNPTERRAAAAVMREAADMLEALYQLAVGFDLGVGDTVRFAVENPPPGGPEPIDNVFIRLQVPMEQTTSAAGTVSQTDDGKIRRYFDRLCEAADAARGRAAAMGNGTLDDMPRVVLVLPHEVHQLAAMTLQPTGDGRELPLIDLLPGAYPLLEIVEAPAPRPLQGAADGRAVHDIEAALRSANILPTHGAVTLQEIVDGVKKLCGVKS